MSALPVPVARRLPTPQPRPQLRVVAPRRRRLGHLAYLAVCVGLGLVTLLALLALHMATSQGSYESFRIHQQLAGLQTERLAAQEALARLGAPEVLENKARDLGMVPAQNPLFINLAAGNIVGTWPEGDQGGTGNDGEPADSETP
jgi:hypothetical protein